MYKGKSEANEHLPAMTQSMVTYSLLSIYRVVVKKQVPPLRAGIDLSAVFLIKSFNWIFLFPKPFTMGLTFTNWFISVHYSIKRKLDPAEDDKTIATPSIS